MKVAPFASLDSASYREIVRRALAEDVRWGDVTTEAIVPAELKGAVVEALTRTIIEHPLNLGNPSVADAGEVGAFGEEVPQQAVGGVRS